jgi:phosphoserine phosphatase
MQVTPAMLTTEDFHASIAELNPRVAVFDCDGTLWSGDAGSSFMAWTVERGLLSDEAVQWLADRYEGYKRGEVSELAICGEMVQVYKGLREEQVRDAAREFFHDRVEAYIFPELQQAIQTLQAQGVDIWAVSSTNDWVIEEGMTRFNIAPNRVLAARVQVVNGIVTDRVLDVPTDEGKVASLVRAGITQLRGVRFPSTRRLRSQNAVSKRTGLFTSLPLLSLHNGAYVSVEVPLERSGD